MSSQADYDKRLAEEVGSLSTRLVTAVNKQVELEETILELRKQVSALKLKNEQLNQSDIKLKTILPKYIKLQDDYRETLTKKKEAESQNTKLQGEVEDLTASLFDEANTMVSNASRETHNFKIKNRKLYEELDEKNIIINDLQEQLQDLKQMFIKMEEQNFNETNSIHTNTNFSESKLSKYNTRSTLGDEESQNYNLQQLQRIIYSPLITSIRFDLNNYNIDFKGFVYQLIKPDFQFDLSHLKTIPFFKSIWQSEIENCIHYIPSLPATTTLLNRWQKGKTFWGSLIEGKVSIEPIKGSNETFKLTYKGNNASGNSSNENTDNPCTFCGEARNDSLEHCRLYHLKLFESNTANNSGNNSTNQDQQGNNDNTHVIASYPLCNYCLIKLRNLCDFFAKIRLIRSNIFKLKQNDSFDEFIVVPGSFGQFKRSNTISNRNGTYSSSSTSSSSTSSVSSSSATTANGESLNSTTHNIQLERTEESKLIKLYIMMLLIRSKIFWSKLGFWDTIDQINEINLDEIHYEAFSYLIPKPTQQQQQQQGDIRSQSNFNSPRQSVDGRSVLSGSISSPRQPNLDKQQKDSIVDETVAQLQRDGVVRSETASAEEKFEDAISDETDGQEQLRSEKLQTGKTVTEPNSVSESEPVQEPEQVRSKSNNNTNNKNKDTKIEDSDAEHTFSLKRSHSKQFKDQLNKELDQTLEMLAENIDFDESSNGNGN
ncbi:GDP/GTP exchange factor Sec2p family protein [Candida albicans]|uniref:GDP/GTP exchange factor Sec2p family protein n=1 Tax=Candida albicans TaxID=5476 RepID=A0A8H6C106_CANAX|nr:GDP/GTP exchange factor Sec2p family protein [Candida albicans]